MAAPVLPLQPTKLPPGPLTLSPEKTYWRSFKSQLLLPTLNNSPATHVSSSHIFGLANHDLFAVSAGARVNLYSCKTRKLTKSIARFDDTAHSPDIRRDGRTLVAGDDSGAVQVFDVGSRAILKRWNEHKQPVWTTKFSPWNPTSLLSASDDRTVKVWDLPAQESLVTLAGHQDYVRCGTYLSGQASGLLVSGSYDQTVKVWDHRAQTSAVMTFEVSDPVEDVLSLSSGTSLAVASGHYISILDLVAAKPLQILNNHQKTVTSMCLASKGSRLLSASLDGHIKVFETERWNVVFGSKYTSPVLALSVLPVGSNGNDKHIVAGLQSGNVSIKTRFSGIEKDCERKRQREMQAMLQGNEKKLAKIDKKRNQGQRIKARGSGFQGESADIVIANAPKGNYKPKLWEQLLRKGNYSSALNVVLELGDLQDTLTLLTALRHRSAMRTALSGRDEKSLRPIYQWVCKYITSPRYVSICVDVGMLILDIYAQHTGDAPEFDRQTRRMHLTVRKEVERSQQAWQTKGMLSMLVAPP